MTNPSFSRFLVEAKRNTYASGAKPRKKGGFDELTYKKGDLLYTDRWSGSNPFGGEEVVRKAGSIIWIMNYYGRTFSTKVDNKKVVGHLRKALKHVTAGMPFRGPPRFEKAELLYINKRQGNISRFSGIERILHKGKEVYRLDYHGGEI